MCVCVCVCVCVCACGWVGGGGRTREEPGKNHPTESQELQRVRAELAGLKEEYKTAIQMLRDERSERKRLDEEVAHERRLRLMAEAARDRALGRV